MVVVREGLEVVFVEVGGLDGHLGAQAVHEVGGGFVGVEVLVGLGWSDRFALS